MENNIPFNTWSVWFGINNSLANKNIIFNSNISDSWTLENHYSELWKCREFQKKIRKNSIWVIAAGRWWMPNRLKKFCPKLFITSETLTLHMANCCYWNISEIINWCDNVKNINWIKIWENNKHLPSMIIIRYYFDMNNSWGDRN